MGDDDDGDDEEKDDVDDEKDDDDDDDDAVLPQFEPSSSSFLVSFPYRPPRPGRQPARQRPWGRSFGHHEPAHRGADGADQTWLGARPDRRLLLVGWDGPGEHRLLRVGEGERCSWSNSN